MKVFALERRSNTAFALRNRDTRLAVRLSPVVVEFRDGDEVVDPFKLLLLPLSLSLNVGADELLLLSRSIDMAWRRLANNCFALLAVDELAVLLLISLMVDVGELWSFFEFCLVLFRELELEEAPLFDALALELFCGRIIVLLVVF